MVTRRGRDRQKDPLRPPLGEIIDLGQPLVRLDVLTFSEGRRLVGGGGTLAVFRQSPQTTLTRVVNLYSLPLSAPEKPVGPVPKFAPRS